jgi:hypothetical protein
VRAVKLLLVALTAGAVLAAGAASVHATSAGETDVTGAGSAAFPDGATYGFVALSESTFGLGAVVAPTGSAQGVFQAVLTGTRGEQIAVEGTVTTGSASVGNADLSGSAMINDGAVLSVSPFSVTVTPNTLQVTLAAVPLPTQTVEEGSIFIGAAVPTSLSVTSFGARRTRQGVLLRWQTRSETRIAGFHVYRLQGGKQLRRNRALLRAQYAGQSRGAAYSFRDRLPARARVMRYRLQLVYRDGSRSWYGTVAVARRAAR